MVNGNIFVNDLDFEFKLWKSQLNSLLDEYHIKTNRAIELKSEGYLDQTHLDTCCKTFKALQKNIIKALKEIKLQEEKVSYYACDYPISRDHEHYVAHEKAREMINTIKLNHLTISKKYNLAWPVKVSAPVINSVETT